MNGLTLSMKAAAIAAVLAITTAAEAGPPMICHPVEIGTAESLPFGKDAFSTAKDFSPGRLVDETVRILDRNGSALVHMETLRRAAIYCDEDGASALRLVATLMARALDAEASGRPAALPWFDAGYFAQCCHQLGIRLDVPCGIDSGIVGYGWVKRAIAIAGQDAELEFGAAMMTALARVPQHAGHASAARKLAAGDSLVARNLEVHSTKYWR